MNRHAIFERLKSAPNPIIDNYRKIVDHRKEQTIDTNHVGWHVLELMVVRHRKQFFDADGHWRPWKNPDVKQTARSDAERAVSIGMTLTKYWQGKDLNLIQSAMVKPYLKLDKRELLGK